MFLYCALYYPFQTSTSGFSVCSNKGRLENRAGVLSSIELFGECSYSESVSDTEKSTAQSDTAMKSTEQNDNVRSTDGERLCDARKVNGVLKVSINLYIT